jgi:thioredoxin reductase (NADPH)
MTVGDDESLRARAVVVASGARYRRLDVPNLAQFEGSSVHYWASPIEAKLCGGQEVALVGAGNSAGQAAVYLASHVKKVWLLVRRESLEETMSHYLVERIKAQPNIEVVTRCEVTALEGSEGNLESLRLRHCSPNEETTRAISHLFLLPMTITVIPTTRMSADSFPTNAVSLKTVCTRPGQISTRVPIPK